jgi:hypothetical protein
MRRLWGKCQARSTWMGRMSRIRALRVMMNESRGSCGMDAWSSRGRDWRTMFWLGKWSPVHDLYSEGSFQVLFCRHCSHAQLLPKALISRLRPRLTFNNAQDERENGNGRYRIYRIYRIQIQFAISEYRRRTRTDYSNIGFPS